MGCILPTVPIVDIDVVDVIGSGRNGAIYKVYWIGDEAAVKQFDIGRDGTEWFEKELTAYSKLKDEWGTLVPRPMFKAESVSGGVSFLGLQLGRSPVEGDDL